MFRLITVLFFLGIAIVYVLGVAPDMHWMSLGADAADYAAGSEHMRAVRPTSYPLVITLGWIFARLPVNIFWALGLLSAISTLVTCAFVFLIVRLRVPPSKIAPYIGTAAYAASFIVWTQSTLPEVYSITAMLMVMATYFVFKDRLYLAAICLSLGIGTHHMIVWALVPLALYLWWIKRHEHANVSWFKLTVIVTLGFLTYIQVVVCAHFPNETTNGFRSLFTQTGGALPMAFQLSMNLVPQRTFEFVVLLFPFTCVGLPLLWYLKRSKEVVLLVTLAALPILYYYMSIPPQWVTFTVPGIAFLAVLIGLGAGYAEKQGVHKYVLTLVLVLLLLGMVFNLAYYDVGRNVDPSPSTARQYFDSLEGLPDGSIVYSHTWGHAWIQTFYYMVQEYNDDAWPDWGGCRITVVDEGGILYYPQWYHGELERRGVVLPEYIGLDIEQVGGMLLRRPDFKDFHREEFLQRFCDTNEGRPLYIALMVDPEVPMRFELKELVRGTDGKWIIPRDVVSLGWEA